jgi:hypothetical protein
MPVGFGSKLFLKAVPTLSALHHIFPPCKFIKPQNASVFGLDTSAYVTKPLRYQDWLSIARDFKDVSLQPVNA